MKTRRVSILLLSQSEPTIRLIRNLSRRISALSINVQGVGRIDTALELLKKNVHHICIVDVMTGKSLPFVRAAKKAGCEAPIILLVGYGDHEGDVEGMKAGAEDCLMSGSVDETILERSIRYALQRKREKEALRKSKLQLQAAHEQLQKTVQGIEEELETARMVQESLLPRDISSVNGLNVCASYIPCGRIGGDLYDIIALDERRTFFLVFDVVGHGVPAALISAMVKVSFSKYISRDVSPAEIMEQVNREIVNLFHEKRHVTAFLCVFDGITKRLDFVKAGHPSPVLVHLPERKLEYLTNGGLPLGMFAEVRYETSSIQLRSGDSVVLYTDGLTECVNAQENLFGRKRLEDILLSLPQESSVNDILGTVLKAQLVFSGETPRNDDISIVIIKIP